MGETFYDLLVTMFVHEHNRHMGESAVVLSGLTDLSVALACFVIVGVLTWFTRKSMMLRHTNFIYMAGAVLLLSGLERLAHLFAAPASITMALDAASMVTALVAAYMMVVTRHSVVALVFQFKYVVGLLRNMQVGEENNDVR